ncbi:hypothetical protein BOTBODRAFT_191943 [Botryobasidium botryosum FD-172 SS1]|uniref:Uncharacterized protein n=1 Tax=Botryobasidium botryosum (strain FD-172 SS1) TaxID=930990 RepID=A0A067M0I0_BOTB1|nr:hypothetical protein BOTBODRAFT_191943 [Botryobasidium botryosum FD-172 SS1]
MLGMGHSAETWICICSCLGKVSGRAWKDYDGNLLKACIARLSNLETTDDEVSEILSLVVRRLEFGIADWNNTSLANIAGHIRDESHAPSTVFGSLMPIACKIVSGQKGEYLAATRLAKSPLLSAVGMRVGQYYENFPDLPVSTVLDWVGGWSNVAGRLCLTEGCREGVLASGLVPKLVDAWAEGNRRLKEQGIGTQPPPWKGTTHEKILDELTEIARQGKAKFYFL